MILPYLIGCEESGTVRDAMLDCGIPAVSCDLLPSRSDRGEHIQGDIFAALASRQWAGLIAFPTCTDLTCTYLTCSAEWAYGDGPYHQTIKDGTLVGSQRRAARQQAINLVLRLWECRLERITIKNPVGVLSRHIGRPQVIQPYQFGDDASKATCIWTRGFPALVIPPRETWFPPRLINERPRWGNQTDSGQNKLSPGPNRQRDRSKTFPGIAAAMADQWGRPPRATDPALKEASHDFLFM